MRLRDIFAARGIDVDADEEPETLGNGETENPAVDGNENPEPLGDGEIDPTEGDTISGDGGPENDSNGNGVDDEAETLPESETSEDELRDALSTAYAEIESLKVERDEYRARLALIGGDAETEVFDADEPGDAPDPEDDDDYNAEADIAAQRADIAELTRK